MQRKIGVGATALCFVPVMCFTLQLWHHVARKMLPPGAASDAEPAFVLPPGKKNYTHALSLQLVHLQHHHLAKGV